LVDNYDLVHIISWVPSADLIDPAVLGTADAGTLLLLPDKTDDQGHGLYRDDNAGLVKTLRRNGASVVFSHQREHRSYVSEYSAGEIVANIALGVIGNFTTDVISHATYAIRLRVAAALGRAIPGDFKSDESIQVNIARYESSPERKVIEGFECTGPAKEVVRLIESLVDHSADGDSGTGSSG
jgi:hypothetical protein